MDRLKGKVAMVVGAGSIGPGWGNGKATAVTFAREGAEVFCVDRNPAAAEETMGIITKEGGKAMAFTADVSKAADVEAMVAACLKAYGRIDVLDNNVGISYGSYNASKAAMNQMTRSTAVEFAADYVRVNAILPGLMKTPMVEHSAGLAASYSNGDVEAMWRARDAQVPMGHMGEAWDVANAALFLASDESRYVTGIELVVDGGLTCRA